MLQGASGPRVAETNETTKLCPIRYCDQNGMYVNRHFCCSELHTFDWPADTTDETTKRSAGRSFGEIGPALRQAQMASSPFGCNPKKSVFGNKTVLDKQAAPEAVLLLADKSQVITAMIPYNSANAAKIRACMHENVQFDGHKIFIYRAVNGWSNIALDSTAEAPKLTCDPITALKSAWTAFAACPQVGKLTIRWKGEDKDLSYDDVDGMEGLFDPLPDESPAPRAQSVDNKSDAEYLMEKLNEIDKKIELVDLKHAHLVELMEQFINRAEERSSGSTSASALTTPTTTKNTKRKVVNDN